MFWGELIYATPGCGKTYVSNKYRDVVDGDDLIVEAIMEVSPGFAVGHYSDPRKVIFRYFQYIHFDGRMKWRVYNVALRKMRDACDMDDVVLFGTLDLMNEADRIFLENDFYYVRNGFNKDREDYQAGDCHVPVHHIYEYLDNSLQKTCSQGY